MASHGDALGGEGGPAGDDVDDTSQGVGAVQDRRGAAQDLDLLDPVDVEEGGLDAAEVDGLTGVVQALSVDQHQHPVPREAPDHREAEEGPRPLDFHPRLAGEEGAHLRRLAPLELRPVDDRHGCRHLRHGTPASRRRDLELLEEDRRYLQAHLHPLGLAGLEAHAPLRAGAAQEPEGGYVLAGAQPGDEEAALGVGVGPTLARLERDQHAFERVPSLRGRDHPGEAGALRPLLSQNRSRREKQAHDHHQHPVIHNHSR